MGKSFKRNEWHVHDSKGRDSGYFKNRDGASKRADSIGGTYFKAGYDERFYDRAHGLIADIGGLIIWGGIAVLIYWAAKMWLL